MLKKIVSWNVNGIRAIVKKSFIENIRELDPDIVCLQETKASESEVRNALTAMNEYTLYANSSKARKGYSGTAILSKEDPIWVTYGIGIEQYDQEGRVVVAEFSRFFLITVYTPNSGSALARLDYREGWDRAFLNYVQWLNKRKPVVICGDLNVAYQEIDIARPKENYNKSAGYTQREIDGFQQLIESGKLIDTFRHQYPEKIEYTYWNYIANSRTKNIGWRIDYFLISEKLLPAMKNASIHNAYHGSDHCPVAIDIQT